jgi:murein DD-endopeptidase MepM/ murein hydrolase activator NlpD
MWQKVFLTLLLLAFPLLGAPPLASAKPASDGISLRIYPQAPLYMVDIDANRDLRSAMVQNLAIINPSGAQVRLDSLRVEIKAGVRVVQTLFFEATDLDQAAARMAKLKEVGALSLYDFVFQTSRYLDPGVTLASSRVLPPKSAVVMNGIPLLLRGPGDSVRIVAEAEQAGGTKLQVELNLPLRQYQQKNDYYFPLQGVWMVVVGPSFSEPHRWALNEEFALDIVRLGESGKTYHGSGIKLSDFYSYGQEVVAVADGEVVTVETSQSEGNDRFRQLGESAETFMARTVAEQEKLLLAGAYKVLGNYVVVRHQGGEYSHYTHLAAASARVKPGEKVKGGQVLGKLGNTGNSSEPHLHFTVADGPDPLYARSLPVRYSGMTTLADGPVGPSYPQTGWIIEATAKR